MLAFGLDIAAGTSHFNFNPKFKTHHNFAESLILSYYKDAKIYATQYLPVSKIENFPTQSATYKYLYNDSSNKQSLILLESWGLIKDSTLKANEINSFRAVLGDKYQLIIDSSLFLGGTSQAQARELLNKTGQAYYSVIQNHKCDINSIVQEKNNKGYFTTAQQSFSGFHSSSSIFNEAIGFKEIKEYQYFKNIKFNKNHDNFYTSVNDEEVIEYGIKNASNHYKYFLYLITINTHLPFYHHKEIKDDKIKHLFNDDEATGQFHRIGDQLNKIASIIAGSDMDRVVIVEDHAPPFLNEHTRDLYAKDHVPVWVITKKH